MVGISMVTFIWICLSTAGALNPDSCGFMKKLECTGVLTQAMNECQQNKDFQKCYTTIKSNSNCLDCTCSVFPKYCTEKTGKIDPEQPTNPFSTIKISKEDSHYIDIKKILLSAAQCDTDLYSTCEKRFKLIASECLLESNSVECMRKKVKETECNACLCKLLPGFCSKEEEVSAAEKQAAAKKSTAADTNITDVLFGGLLQSGLGSEQLQKLLSSASSNNQSTEGNNGTSELLSKFLQSEEVKKKITELSNNEELKNQLKNFIKSNPEEVSKLAQKIAENKDAENSILNLAEQKLAEAKKKAEEEANKKKLEEEKSQKAATKTKDQSKTSKDTSSEEADTTQIKEEKKNNNLTCTPTIKQKCLLTFLKIVKKCPKDTQVENGNSLQKECVDREIQSNSECSICTCNFMRNLC